MARPAPTMPCTMPSAMNGTRTNQFDAPTSFITSISRLRANVARRIVLTIRNSDEPSSTSEITMKISRTVFVTSIRPLSASPGVVTCSTPCCVLNSPCTGLGELGLLRRDAERLRKIGGGDVAGDVGVAAEDPLELLERLLLVEVHVVS